MNARKTPPGIWKLVLYVTLAHVVIILILSPQFYCSSDTSPEALFARGEQAMAEGKHVEAMQYFRQVMDQQPKPPAIYTRAAEQHRLADRLARQQAGKQMQQAEAETRTGEAPSSQPAMPPTQPTTSPTPREKPTPPAPDAPFIPPELRR